MKLALNYTEVIKGQFALGSTNLMMAFQVNCPGCFLHGFPLLMNLQAHYKSKLSCFALATAFEEFQLNTEENVKLMVNNCEFVGETLKAHKNGLFMWNSKTLTVPVLIDEICDQSILTQPEFAENIIQNKFNLATAFERKNILATLNNYFRQMPKCGKTFAANLMQGTPSFFLFTDSMEILVQWFGHVDIRMIKRELDILIDEGIR